MDYFIALASTLFYLAVIYLMIREKIVKEYFKEKLES